MIHNKTMNVSEFNPMQNFLIVNPIPLVKGPETTDTGLITALEQNESILDRPTTGTILRKGRDCTDYLNIGDEVLWVEQDGMEMEFKDGIFLILKDTSILGIKEGNKS